jgi:hypothetical protein
MLPDAPADRPPAAARLAAPLAAHRAGRHAAAAAGYRRALLADPADTDAAHLLGVALGKKAGRKRDTGRKRDRSK